MIDEGDEPDLDTDALLVEPKVSFEEFFRSEYRSVLGLAFVLCGDRAVAEELTMDGFEAALTRWAGVSRLDYPGGWVRKVVANASVSRFRRLAAERRARARLVPPDVDWGVAEMDVWDAVRRLPRRQAQVVAVYYLEGYSRSETADLLGISEESVKTHLTRARRRLAVELGDS